VGCSVSFSGAFAWDAIGEIKARGKETIDGFQFYEDQEEGLFLICSFQTLISEE
jgi:hypothetical protein